MVFAQLVIKTLFEKCQCKLRTYPSAVFRGRERIAQPCGRDRGLGSSRVCSRSPASTSLALQLWVNYFVSPRVNTLIHNTRKIIITSLMIARVIK